MRDHIYISLHSLLRLCEGDSEHRYTEAALLGYFETPLILHSTPHPFTQHHQYYSPTSPQHQPEAYDPSGWQQPHRES